MDEISQKIATLNEEKSAADKEQKEGEQRAKEAKEEFERQEREKKQAAIKAANQARIKAQREKLRKEKEARMKEQKAASGKMDILLYQLKNEDNADKKKKIQAEIRQIKIKAALAKQQLKEAESAGKEQEEMRKRAEAKNKAKDDARKKSEGESARMMKQMQAMMEKYDDMQGQLRVFKAAGKRLTGVKEKEFNEKRMATI